MKVGNITFDLYGWLIPITSVIGITLSAIHLGIPFLSWLLGGYVYAHLFKKPINKHFVVSAVMTFILMAILTFVVLAVIFYQPIGTIDIGTLINPHVVAM